MKTGTDGKAIVRANTRMIRRLTMMAMLTALSVVLAALIHFPIFPAAPFLEYDPADIPIFIGTFAFGPAAGLLLTAVVSVIQGTTVSAASGIPGIIMHFAATGAFAIAAGNLYRFRKTRGGAVLSLSCGVVVMTAVMTAANLIVTPLFMGAPIQTVLEMLLPVIIPFNLVKAGANALITFFLYKSVSGFLHK